MWKDRHVHDAILFTSKSVQNTNIAMWNEDNNTHTHSLNNYICTHARKTRQRKNYDEKQENRVKEDLFFALFFPFSLSLFLVFYCYICCAWQVVFVSIIPLVSYPYSWTTSDNVSNHVILSCIKKLGQIRYRYICNSFSLLRCCCFLLLLLFVSLGGIDRRSGKKKERDRGKSGTRKKTKDLMKIDGRKNPFLILFFPSSLTLVRSTLYYTNTIPNNQFSPSSSSNQRANETYKTDEEAKKKLINSSNILVR
jgi:hypothetical protein